MSTRGVLGFVIGGKEKVTYNHFDSYPDGLGNQVLKFLKSADIAEVKEKAEQLVLVDDEDTPTDDQIQKLLMYADLRVATQSMDDWYVLLHETQGKPQSALDAGFMINGRDFAFDSLFCEWGYIIDLDNEVLEVYDGFQTEEHDKGRFANGLKEPYKSFDGTKFYSVALVRSYSFSDLPEDFNTLEDEIIDEKGEN